jgi:hypothetical protein
MIDLDRLRRQIMSNEEADQAAAELRAAREVRDRILRALDKFERDLAFTAPELTGMRIGLLREAIEDAFQPEDDEETSG